MTRRNEVQLLALARMLENLAHIYPDAITHLHHQAAQVDGYPAGTDSPKVTSSSELTPTEAAAEARLTYTRQADDLRAGYHLLVITIHDMTNDCHKALRGGTPVEAPRLCDPSGHEGCLIPLAEGGWADYTCRELASRLGLCDRHYMARRRWRAQHGLSLKESA